MSLGGSHPQGGGGQGGTGPENHVPWTLMGTREDTST